MKRVAVVLALAACDRSMASDAGDSGAFDAGADAARPDGPYGIRCTLSARDITSGETKFQTGEVVLFTDTDRQASTSAHGIDLEAAVEPIASAPDSATFRVSVPTAGLVHDLRISRSRPPPYEYGGFSGLTGLVYVPVQGLDVQYSCSAAAKSMPPPVGPTSNAAPHVRCAVHRHAAPADDQEDVLDLTGAGEQTTKFAAANVRLIVNDDSNEGERSAVIQILPTALLGRGGFETQQALQIDRTHAFPNLFGAELGITGLMTRSASDGEVLSYACVSVD